MLGVAFSEFGGPDVLRVMELPDPKGEVVVRVVASTVNPTDTLMRSGQQSAMMAELVPPYVAGVEFAGYVENVTDRSSAIVIGQRVMGIVNARRPGGGSHAQYVGVPAASVAAIAEGVDMAEAATVPMNGLTAKIAVDAMGLHPGDSVLITGGSGTVGGYAIQLARIAGLTVVADAKDADVELLRRLGADEVVPRGEGMGEAIRRRWPIGVDGLIDAALLGERAGSLVRDGGIAISLRKSHAFRDPRLRSHTVAVFDHAGDTPALIELRELLAQGNLSTCIGSRLPMAEAAQAHRLVEKRGVRGRVVLTFQ